MRYREDTYILIHTAASDTICVVEALDHFGSQDILAIGDVESSSFVEGRLVRRKSRNIPREAFGPDSGKSLVVCIFASFHELEAKVDILLLVQDQAS